MRLFLCLPSVFCRANDGRPGKYNHVPHLTLRSALHLGHMSRFTCIAPVFHHTPQIYFHIISESARCYAPPDCALVKLPLISPLNFRSNNCSITADRRVVLHKQTTKYHHELASQAVRRRTGDLPEAVPGYQKWGVESNRWNSPQRATAELPTRPIHSKSTNDVPPLAKRITQAERNRAHLSARQDD